MDKDVIGKCIELAHTISEDKTLDNYLPYVDGYTSRKVRVLLNLLGRYSTNYLEIGVHLGSTFSAAIWSNPHLTATCIDNWSLFGNLRNQFEENIRRICHYDQYNHLRIIERDAFTVPLQDIPDGIDLYFYDGDHARKPQYDALAYFYPRLANRFVFLVDDANWEEPREETRHAIKDLNLNILYQNLLPAKIQRDTENWWNGLYVLILEKNQ